LQIFLTEYARGAGQTFVQDLQIGISDVDNLVKIERAISLKVELYVQFLQIGYRVNNSVDQGKHGDSRGLDLIALLEVFLEVFD
jgi:hypothetical protein